MISLERLQQIIPADQALANKALAVSLQQISGISAMQLPTLAKVVSNMETTRNLPAVTALTTAVPPYVANYYINNLGGGSGPNGTILITDILGLAAGWKATDAFTRTVEIFSTMDLSYLTLIYETIKNVLAGVYNSGVDPDGYTIITIPPGLPGAGTYEPTVAPNPDPPPANIQTESASSKAIAVLDSEASAEIAHLVVVYPTQTTELNSLWTQMAQQVVNEKSLQAKAKLDFTKLTTGDYNSIYSLIYNLTRYGQDTQVGGMSWFMENVSNLSIFSGQAIVGCLREGRNLKYLNNGGVPTTTTIPSDPKPPPPQASMIASTYTAQEAANLVIK